MLDFRVLAFSKGPTRLGKQMESNAPIISALSYEGLTATTSDGKPAHFAIVDESGNVVARGKQVADAAFHTSIEAYRRFLIAEGHLRVYTKAEALAMCGNPKS